MVEDLSVVSPEFAELWARHEVGAPSQTVKAVRHPMAGELFFDVTALSVTGRPDWSLVLYNPQPGTVSSERLERTPRVRLAALA